MAETRQAILYRMVLTDHVCPYGVRAKEMLEHAGFDVDDRILRTRDEVERAKEEFGQPTTPVIVIDGVRIGGSRELEAYLGQQNAPA